jgi:hypothetical protein
MERRTTTRRSKLTREQAATHLEDWRRSGEPLAKYAARVGLSYQRLHRWRKQLGVPRPSTAFLPVRIIEADRPAGQAASVLDACIEIEGPGGFLVRIRPDFDEAALGRVLRVVRSLAC